MNEKDEEQLRSELVRLRKRVDELECAEQSVDAPRIDIGDNPPMSFSTEHDITERKLAEEALRISEEHLKDTFDLSPSIISKANIDTGYFIDANQAVTRILGYSVEEFTSTPIMEMIHPSDVQRTTDEVEEQLKGKDVTFFENRYLCKDGSYKWMAWHGTKADQHGIVTAIGSDIAERKQAEREILDTKQFYEDIIEGVQEGIWVTDKNDVIHFANRGMEEIAGVPREKIHGNNILQDFPKETTGELISYYQQAKKESKPTYYEIAVKTPAGLDTFQNGWLIPRIVDGKYDGMICTIRDVTERKQAEEALKESEYRLRLSLESAKAGSWIWNIETDEVIWDDRMQEIFGFEPGTYDGKYESWANAVHPDDREEADKQTRMALENGTNYDFQYRLNIETEKGLWRTVRSQALVISDEKGERIRMAGLCEDITEQKEAEQRERALQKRLARSERMESLGILAGGVAHDLNNLLGPMVSLPDIISDDLASSEELNVEEALQTLGIIKSSAIRAASTVKDLVSLGRRGHYSLRPLNINECYGMAEDCACIKEIRGNHPGVTIAHKLQEGPLIIAADESHFSRAFNNLLQNAAESIEKKGEVTISTTKRSIGEPITGYETVPGGDYAVIEIADTGTGIQEGVIARIFEPFFTDKEQTKRSGSGLGLAVVHGIIKDHNGFIDVQSTIGKGSVFTLYMPLVDHPKEEEKETPPPAAIVGGKESILVVDDEHSLRFTGRKGLKRLGYEVAEAENGHEALAYFEKAKSASKDSPYDLIVLDMIMEDHYDGLQTYEDILKLFPNQKAIICSGFAENARSKAAQELGADWLAKPYKLDELGLAVRKRLDVK